MTSGITMGNVRSMHIISVTFDPASVAANTTAEQTVTVPGARSYHVPMLVKPSLTAGLGIVNVRVSANDTLAVTFSNNTASPIDAASEVYTCFLAAPEGNFAPTTIGS